ncbi:MAG: hypothetical protein LBJ93_01390 [Clostridiales bacterium]|nr:hypothetical protein [Clostridiales bacterium]
MQNPTAAEQQTNDLELQQDNLEKEIKLRKKQNEYEFKAKSLKKLENITEFLEAIYMKLPILSFAILISLFLNEIINDDFFSYFSILSFELGFMLFLVKQITHYFCVEINSEMKTEKNESKRAKKELDTQARDA